MFLNLVWCYMLLNCRQHLQFTIHSTIPRVHYVKYLTMVMFNNISKVKLKFCEKVPGIKIHLRFECRVYVFRSYLKVKAHWICENVILFENLSTLVLFCSYLVPKISPRKGICCPCVFVYFVLLFMWRGHGRGLRWGWNVS